jgi:hypothetical protein
MDYSSLKRLLISLSKRKANLNIRLVIFTFFVFVATILWYLNNLTYEYSTEITFPLRIENMPRGKVLIGEPPKNITLQVRAYGYTLLRYKMGASLSPLFLDLDQLPLLPISGSDSKFFILTSTIRNSFLSQLSGDLQLGIIPIDSLFFEFTKMASKRVEVFPIVNYSIEKQHMLAGPVVLKPDSITISGPQTLIDTINRIKTKPIRLDRLTANHSSTVYLQDIYQVGFSHRRVTLDIPVEKFTEANVSSNIIVRNLPDTLRLILLPRSINIKCNVLISRYKNLNQGEVLKPYVDFNDLQTLSGNRLIINIESQPYVVTIIDYEPKYVDYIIERI